MTAGAAAIDQSALLEWAAGYAPDGAVPSAELEPAPDGEPDDEEGPQGPAAGAKGSAARRRAEQRAARASEARSRRRRLAVKRGLKDGCVVLRILMEIFPSASVAMAHHLQERPANRFAVNHNWKCISACFQQLGLPTAALDRAGLSVCRDKATNMILATLYFLQQLKRRPNFTAAFSFRLGDAIETFLQSGECLTSLARGGAVPSAVHLQESLDFEPQVPAALTDPQWMWRNGAGNPALRDNAQPEAAPRPKKTGRSNKSKEGPVRGRRKGGPGPGSRGRRLVTRAPAADELAEPLPAPASADGESTSDSAPELAGGERLTGEEQEELLYLRKLRAVHTKQIKAMTESNNTLQLMVQTLEASVAKAAQREASNTAQEGGGAPAGASAEAGGRHGTAGARQDPQQRLLQRHVDESLAAAKRSAEKLQESEAARETLAASQTSLQEQLVTLSEAHGKLQQAHADSINELALTSRELEACKETSEMLELELREQSATLDELLRQQPDSAAARCPAAEPPPAEVEDSQPWGSRRADAQDAASEHAEEEGGRPAAATDGAAAEPERVEADAHFAEAVAEMRVDAARAVDRAGQTAPAGLAERASSAGSDGSSTASTERPRKRAVRFKSESVICAEGDDDVVRIALCRPARSLKILALEEKRGRWLGDQAPWQGVFRGSTRRRTRYSRPRSE